MMILPTKQKVERKKKKKKHDYNYNGRQRTIIIVMLKCTFINYCLSKCDKMCLGEVNIVDVKVWT